MERLMLLICLQYMRLVCLLTTRAIEMARAPSGPRGWHFMERFVLLICLAINETCKFTHHKSYRDGSSALWS